VQSDKHPRLSTVFPSSHNSVPAMIESPQISVQVDFVSRGSTEQLQPPQFPMQFALHPHSGILVKLSSQFSVPTINPSSQISTQTVAVVLLPGMAEQSHPGIIPLLSARHPQPLFVPSSHTSFPTLFPSLGISVQIVGVEASHDQPANGPLQVELQYEPSIKGGPGSQVSKPTLTPS